MISYLRGKVHSISEENLTLDVNGVGYEAHCSSSTLLALTIGQMAELQIHTVMREDALQLFGFLHAAEKNMFLSLLKVNGVGPKMAAKILSGAPIESIVRMIENSDVRALSQLPKVGKKTAEQLVLSLKGKLDFQGDASAATPAPVAGGPRGEIISALVNLGFRLGDVEMVVKNLPDDVEFQQGVRLGLQGLTMGTN